jgi:predicted Zn-dependent peptidase
MNNNLQNIKYLKFQNDCLNSCTILFLFNVGSINENSNNHGISHFVEHMLFKGTANIPKSSVLLKKIDSYGSDYNAFTTNDVTGYHIKTMKKYQLDVFKLFYDMLFNSIFNEDEIEIERQVIKEEYNKDSNDISSITDELIMETVFEGTDYQHPVIGYLENINKINRKDILKYWKKYYTKENCVVVLNGNIEKELIQHIDSIQIKNIPMIYKTHSLKETQNYKFKFKNDNHTDQTILTLCFKTLGFKDKNRYKYDLIANILGGNMSSKLFMSLREKYGLIYDIDCHSNNFKDLGYIEINCSFDNKNFEKTFQYLFEEIKHLKLLL